MSIEYTLSIIKPDATKRNITGTINSYFEKNNLKIVAQKMLTLNKKQIELFYYEHINKGFFPEFLQFMSSGPVVVQVLKGENAIMKNREIMGATDPKQASPGTIRKDLAHSIGENCVHGSDSASSAQKEISFFFAGYEILE